MNQLQDTSKAVYTGWIRRLIAFTKKDRQHVTLEDLTSFFIALMNEYHNSPKTVSVAYYAIRRHYRRCLAEMPPNFQGGFEREIAACKPKRPRSLPLCDTALISPDEAEAWIKSIRNPTLQAMAWLCYNPGMSAQAVSELCLSDARWVPVPPHLKTWWGEYVRILKIKKSAWLWPNGRGHHLSASYLFKAVNAAKKSAGFNRSGAGVRLLRTVGIIRLLREEGRDPNEVMLQAGIETRAAFLPYLKMAMS